MKLSKYYLQATLIPFLITVVITSILATIENMDYKSEWLTAESVTIMVILGTVLYCLFLNVLCLTIFLCKLEVVRNNGLLTVLSWFLLPLSLSALIVLNEFSFSHHPAASGDLLYILSLNGPYTIGLVWAYVNYKKATQPN